MVKINRFWDELISGKTDFSVIFRNPTVRKCSAGTSAHLGSFNAIIAQLWGRGWKGSECSFTFRCSIMQSWSPHHTQVSFLLHVSCIYVHNGRRRFLLPSCEIYAKGGWIGFVIINGKHCALYMYACGAQWRVEFQLGPEMQGWQDN